MNKTTLPRLLRVFLVGALLVQALLAAAFVMQVPAVVQLWPFAYTSGTSFTFISAILAASAASTLWCVVADERASLAGLSLDFVTIMAPAAVFSFLLAADGRNSPALLSFALVCAVSAVAATGLLAWSVRYPFRDRRPMPRAARVSFLAFALVLIAAGVPLVGGAQTVLPWGVTSETATLYGWFFLGAASYFTYGVVRPLWQNTGGQLTGFLAYDVVLFVPLLRLWASASDAQRVSLLIYVAVVTYSAALALYYLGAALASRASAGQEPLHAPVVA